MGVWFRLNLKTRFIQEYQSSCVLRILYLNLFVGIWGPDATHTAITTCFMVYLAILQRHKSVIACKCVHKAIDFDIIPHRIKTLCTNAGMKRSYRGLSRFQRLFRLPEDVAPEGIQAKTEHGVLHILVPKTEEAKMKQQVKEIPVA